MFLRNLPSRRRRCCNENGSYKWPIVDIEDVAYVRVSSSDGYWHVLRIHIWRKVGHDFFYGDKTSEDGVVRGERLRVVSLSVYLEAEMMIVQDPFYGA